MLAIRILPELGHLTKVYGIIPTFIKSKTNKLKKMVNSMQ